MELPRVAIFTVYRHNKPQSLDTKHLFSEVVLLDKTFSPDHPLLYKLHMEALAAENNSYVCRAHSPSLHQHAELISCNIVELNHQAKEITVCDEMTQTYYTVRYKYLIILSGDRNSSLYANEKDEALAAGLCALNHAIKMRDQLERLPTIQSPQVRQTKATASNAISVSGENIRLLEDMLRNSQQRTSNNSLNLRRLLQVQT